VKASGLEEALPGGDWRKSADWLRGSTARDHYGWSTPKSAAFVTAMIILALVLARVLAIFIDLQPT